MHCVNRRHILALSTATIGVAYSPQVSSAKIEANLWDAPTTKLHSFAGKWAFRTDPYIEGDEGGWWRAAHDDARWDQMDVPGVWDTVDVYSNYAGVAWYRLKFNYDASWANLRARLVFESVYNDAEVWLNGVKLGESTFGFLPFYFEVTSLLNTNTVNTLVVRVDNQFKRGAVWNWGGIRRPVYLELTASERIERVYVDAVPDLKQGTANIKIRTRLSTNRSIQSKATVQLRLMREGQYLSEPMGPTDAILTHSGRAEVTTAINLPANLVKLWHFNEPNLYTIEATLFIDGVPAHTLFDQFGIRKIETRGQELLLNGEPVRLVGFNIVAEDRFYGNSLPLARIKEDVDLMKSLNANFSRLTSMPLPGAYLDYLDQVGYMTFGEIGLWGKDLLVDPDARLPKEWLERMVDAQYNHPSIVGWSVGNEIGDMKKNPKVDAYVKGAIQHAKALDPDRLAVYVSYTADEQPDDPVRYCDIVMFNKYSDHENRLKQVHAYNPDKAIFFSEIGSNPDSEDPNLSIADPQAMMGALHKYPYLIGTSMFAFNDYRSNWKSTNPAWTTPPSENRSWGVVDIYRKPKRSFERFKAFYAPVEGFELNRQGEATTLSVTPRSSDTFPSFTLKNYRIVWMAYTVDGTPIKAKAIALPIIKPNAPPFTINIDAPSDAAMLQVDLLDPSGYSVLSKRQYKRTPLPPKVRAVHTNMDTIRVVFDRVRHADQYRLVTTAPDGTVKASDPTINTFVDVTGLLPQTNYKLDLVAINGAGQSMPSGQGLHAQTSPNEIPPVIWTIHPDKDAFFIGFSSDITDYRYEIQYGLKSGQYTKQFLISTRGATCIPAIQSGAEHCFRFRRLVTGSVASQWTEEHCVKLLDGQGLEPPETAYALRSEAQLVIALTPVEGATGYRISTKGHSVDTRLAQSSFIVVSDKILGKASALMIQTLDGDGKIGAEKSVVML